MAELSSELGVRTTAKVGEKREINISLFCSVKVKNMSAQLN